MKVRKISNLSVQISKFSKYDAEGAIISVPWKERKKERKKERFRILLFGKLHIRVQKVPMMTFTSKNVKIVKDE